MNKPTYAIESVDKALLLATLIHREGPQRVTDAADLVGVSVSTAHRLFAMLVYRGFAVQLGDRRYGPGPLLTDEPTESSPTPLRLVRNAALPHLAELARVTGESTFVAVRAGLELRVIASVESHEPVRVGDRTGFTLPLFTSGMGRAILSRSCETEVDALIAEADVDRDELRSALAVVRERGYDVNEGRTEDGLSAIGVAFEAYGGLVGLAVAMPSTRFAPAMVPGIVAALHETAEAIHTALLVR